MQARLETGQALMADGYRLPLKVWSGDTSPSIVVLGLHGFNDYANAFGSLGQDLARRGITTYAVDQRGFGGTLLAGRWHGIRPMVEDLRSLIRLLRLRHPDARMIVAGESMGGAIVMLASAQQRLDVDGLILIAPAVWSRAAMPWYQRLALKLAMHTLPEMTLTGEGIRRSPSDNQAMLRAMGADPLVIKATRVEALWGITNLMDAARASAKGLQTPLLLLYGERDAIIPKNAFCGMLGNLRPNAPGVRFVLYRRGWHMLPRDLQGARVRSDIAVWLTDPEAQLPSGEETPLNGSRAGDFCRGMH